MKILVTGATGGIGREVARLAAERGHELVLTARDACALERVRAGCAGAAAGRHAVRALDLADRDGLEGEIRALFEELGPFDAVVHCAGDCPVSPAKLLTQERLERTVLLHCGSFALMVRELAADRRGGAAARRSAVAVSSVSAREGWAGGAAYCAAKGALSAMCRALDAELSPRVRVRAIEPGHVDTPMFRNGAMRMGVSPSEAVPSAAVARSLLEIL